ncbi:MAG: DUF6554 family protein [Cyanobium sp.]
MDAHPPWSSRCFSAGAAITALITGLIGLGAAPGLAQAQAQAGDSPGSKGAQVYCFMRTNGNNHEVSWTAAYALIKRQGASMFRTSPEHAAVMITEAVVQNPTSFPDCGRYLGDLYSRRVQSATASTEAPTGTATAGGNAGTGGQTRSDRYGN